MPDTSSQGVLRRRMSSPLMMPQTYSTPCSATQLAGFVFCREREGAAATAGAVAAGAVAVSAGAGVSPPQPASIAAVSASKDQEYLVVVFMQAPPGKEAEYYLVLSGGSS